MNSSNYGSKIKRRIYLGFLLVLFFFLFDKGIALIVRELNFSFYNNVNLKKNPYGVIKVIEKGYFDSMVFGSSRTNLGILPVHLYKYAGLTAYSEAKPDRYPRYFYLFYKNHKKIFGRPKYVFYGIDYFMFKVMTRRAAIRLISKKRREIKRLNILGVIKKNPQPFSRFSWTFGLKEKISIMTMHILEHFSLKLEPTNANQNNAEGIRLYFGKKGSIKPEDRVKPYKWTRFSYIDSGHGEGKYFKMLLEELEKDGVTVFLVVIPDYIGTYLSNVEQPLLLKDLKALINGRKNFFILNYNTPEKFELENPEYFIDGGYGKRNSHLSEKGVSQFNRILTNEIKEIIEKNKPGEDLD